jgi:membrane protein YqaA with SNARE-associated domain
VLLPPFSPSLFDQLLLRLPFLARLQDWVIALGKRKSAVSWLMGLGFLESIIFPIPIDPLLAGIVMARPHHYIRLAVLTAVVSTLGGVVGWWIGLEIGDAITTMGWLGEDTVYQAVAAGFVAYGWALVLIGAFTPLPYKVVAVSAGFLGIGIIPMVLASLVGRTARFVLVAAIVHHRSNNKIVGLLSILLIVLVVIFWGMVH